MKPSAIKHTKSSPSYDHRCGESACEGNGYRSAAVQYRADWEEMSLREQQENNKSTTKFCSNHDVHVHVVPTVAPPMKMLLSHIRHLQSTEFVIKQRTAYNVSPPFAHKKAPNTEPSFPKTAWSQRGLRVSVGLFLIPGALRPVVQSTRRPRW